MKIRRFLHRLAVAVLAVAVLVIRCPDTVAVTPDDSPNVSIQTSDATELIRCNDILKYDWEMHTITLRPGLRNKLAESLRGKLVTGYGFQLVVNDKVIYTGTLTTSASSVRFTTPVIALEGVQVLHEKLKGNQIRIDPGYPPDEILLDEDPRGDKRIKEALLELGKLEE